MDDSTFSIDIFRQEKDKTWILEVINYQNTSHVWGEQFVSHRHARLR